MPHNDTDESAPVESEQALPTTIECAANMAAVQYVIRMAVQYVLRMTPRVHLWQQDRDAGLDLDEARGREAGTRGTGAVPLRQWDSNNDKNAIAGTAQNEATRLILGTTKDTPTEINANQTKSRTVKSIHST